MTELVEISPDEIQGIIEENRELTKQVFDLKSLFEACKSLGTTLDTAKTLENLIVVATNLMRARDASILLVDRRTGNLIFKITHGAKGTELVDMVLPRGHGIAGWVAENGKGLIVNDPENDPRFDKTVSEKLKYKTETLLSVPIKSGEKVIGVIQLLNKKAGGKFNEKDLRLLESFGSYAGIVLTNSLMYEDIMIESREEFEKTIALGIQKSLLPVRNPQISGFELSVYNHPSKIVRGDYYDFLENKDNLYLVLESNTETGIIASILATIFRSTLKSIILCNIDFKDIDRYLKEAIKDDVEGNLDKLSYSLIQINKASNDMLFFTTGKMLSVKITKETISSIKCNNEPLKIELGFRDKLLFVSNGVIDILSRNRDGLSAEAKLKEIVSSGYDMDTGSLVETIFMSLSSIAPETEILEDITLVAIEKK
ncbi:MAG: GAF domain-containing protein [Candidatus Hydrogenedentota bacterium]